jgi:hypothetical protein
MDNQPDNKTKPHKSERGRGTVYEKNGAWHLQFYTREMSEGQLVRVRKSVKLADKDREHNWATCNAVRLLRDAELLKVSTARPVTGEELKIVDFWTVQYLPYCEKVLPPPANHASKHPRCGVTKPFGKPTPKSILAASPCNATTLSSRDYCWTRSPAT